MDPIRIGILGAAKINTMALVVPARNEPGISVHAIAARDPGRAYEYAKKHGIPIVHQTYRNVIEDPEIDAIYIPLPNGLHYEWALAAIEAGKHVLCEKPFTSNAAQAEHLAEASERSGKVVMEAFHYRYHPVADRMCEIVRSGELGKVQHVEALNCVPLAVPGNIRYRLDLAGGATMDVGCYAIHMLRSVSGEEPEVVSAEARLSSPQVDRWMRAEMKLPSGATGRMTCALFSARLLDIRVIVIGTEGELRVTNPLASHLYHRIKVRGASGVRTERLSRTSTYVYQLRAFIAAVREGAPIPTDVRDAVLNMRVIDEVYRHAGLELRT